MTVPQDSRDEAAPDGDDLEVVEEFTRLSDVASMKVGCVGLTRISELLLSIHTTCDIVGRSPEEP